MTEETKTILLCGVGGQGTILAADLLAFGCMLAGREVKVSEIHGMAQRGGAVTTVVRVGKTVHSMVSSTGTADVIVSFETTEALRNLSDLKEGGSLIVNDEAIKPLSALTGKAAMPHNARGELQQVGALLVPANELASEAGNTKTANVVLLGALTTYLDISEDVWEQAIASRVPERTIKANLSAFHAGRAYVTDRSKL